MQWFKAQNTFSYIKVQKIYNFIKSFYYKSIDIDAPKIASNIYTKERKKAVGGGSIYSPIFSVISFFQSKQSWTTHLCKKKKKKMWEWYSPYFLYILFNIRVSDINTTFIFHTVTTSTSFKYHFSSRSSQKNFRKQ